jgi:hypothetical protein
VSDCDIKKQTIKAQGFREIIHAEERKREKSSHVPFNNPSADVCLGCGRVCHKPKE